MSYTSIYISKGRGSWHQHRHVQGGGRDHGATPRGGICCWVRMATHVPTYTNTMDVTQLDTEQDLRETSSRIQGIASATVPREPSKAGDLIGTRVRSGSSQAFQSIVSARMIPRAVTSAENGVSEEGFTAMNRVAYQGVPGAYSEMAAQKACPGWGTLPCEQFEVAFQALSQWMAERAVLPIENSLGGSIHTVYDLLLRYRLHIVGEVAIAVDHCLLALPGVKKSDITRVISHPQALAQTDGYIRAMPGALKEAVDDTAGAAKMIAEHGWTDAAAVASRRAAEIYQLDILDESIQDMKDNVTRFIVLSRDPLVTSPKDSAQYKTSVVFSLVEGPGVLFKALSVFALRDINLTKIESRPMRSSPIFSMNIGEENMRGFNYLFYIDFIGALSDPACQNALRHLQEIATFLRVLGTYPRDLDL
jgi:arogenate/prephenate dehydratase